MTIESIHFPYLPVTISVGEISHETEARLDTGFDGELMIPWDLAERFDSSYLLSGFTEWRVGSGAIVPAPSYSGVIRVGNLPPIENATMVVMGDELVIGVGIASRYGIYLDHGRRVTVAL